MLEFLETVPIAGDINLNDFRYPVQTVIRPNLDYRGFAGQVASGVVKKGDAVKVMPSGKTSTVTHIDTWDGDNEEAFAPLSVTLRLADEIDISRGDLIVRAARTSPRPAFAHSRGLLPSQVPAPLEPHAFPRYSDGTAVANGVARTALSGRQRDVDEQMQHPQVRAHDDLIEQRVARRMASHGYATAEQRFNTIDEGCSARTRDNQGGGGAALPERWAAAGTGRSRPRRNSAPSLAFPFAMLCYAMLCYAMLCYAMLCYAMLCYAMLCYAMLCYAMLC